MSRSSFDGSGESQVKYRQGSIANREYFAPRKFTVHKIWVMETLHAWIILSSIVAT